MKYCSSFWKIHKVVMHKYDSTRHEICRAKKWVVWKFWRWVSSIHLCCSTLTKYSILSQAFVFSLGAFLSLLSLFMAGVVVILAVREVHWCISSYESVSNIDHSMYWYIDIFDHDHSDQNTDGGYLRSKALVLSCWSCSTGLFQLPFNSCEQFPLVKNEKNP